MPMRATTSGGGATKGTVYFFLSSPSSKPATANPATPSTSSPPPCRPTSPVSQRPHCSPGRERLPAGGLACGCTALGGSEEFCGVLFSRASSSATRRSRAATCANSARMMACASGGGRAINSSLISRNMPQMSPKSPAARRPVSQPGV